MGARGGDGVDGADGAGAGVEAGGLDAGVAGVLVAVWDGGVGDCGAVGPGSAERVAEGISRPGSMLPGGCDDSTTSKAMMAAIMMPGKKYRISVSVSAADALTIRAAKLA
jgi:hypothetical protein